MATNTKKSKAKGVSLVPDTQPRMTDEDMDRLFVHLLRRSAIFEEGLAQMPLGVLKEQPEKYRVLMRACHDLAKKSKAKPGDKKFKGLLKDAVRGIAKDLDPDSPAAEAAEEIAGEGGFIDEAYAADKGDLSDDLGRALLKRFVYQVVIVDALQICLSDCSAGDQIPKNLPEILDTILGRLRKLEGIDAKAVKSFGEEWEEHEARLEPYRGKELIGLKTGLPQLDRRTRGLRGLIFIGAKPGAGKTSYAGVEVAVGVCRHHADNDCVVVVACLDMERFDHYRRVHCNLGGIEWERLVIGSPEEQREPGSMFSKGDNARLKRAKERFESYEVGKRLTVADRAVLGEDVTAHRLSALIEERKAKAGAKRALLIVDYLQLIPVPEEEAARGDLAADKYRVRVLQQVIERSRTPENPLGDTVLAISEARKPPTKKDIWGDSMAELMGSARIGYAGDAVLLYREMSDKEVEEHYKVEGKAAVEKKRAALAKDGIAPVTLILEKGRDGMTRGKWGAEFFYKTLKFRELPASPFTDKVIPSGDEENDGGTPGVAGHGTSPAQLPPPANDLEVQTKKGTAGEKVASPTPSAAAKAKQKSKAAGKAKPKAAGKAKITPTK